MRKSTSVVQRLLSPAQQVAHGCNNARFDAYKRVVVLKQFVLSHGFHTRMHAACICSSPLLLGRPNLSFRGCDPHHLLRPGLCGGYFASMAERPPFVGACRPRLLSAAFVGEVMTSTNMIVPSPGLIVGDCRDIYSVTPRSLSSHFRTHVR